MASCWPALLSFLIATVVAWLELVTSKYPHSFALLRKSVWLYLYSAIYGVISFLVMLGLGGLMESGTIKLEGSFAGNPWLQAVAVGLSTKALFHIRLFTVTSGSQSFPVGVESIMQIFEPWLLESIDLDEFKAVRSFVIPRAAEYPVLDEVKQRILTNIPNSMRHRREAVKLDLDKCSSVVEVMEVYLRLCGRGTFDLAFPAAKKDA